MSRNGSGTYTLPAGNPVVTGTTISSTWANSTLTNIASALTDSLAADGQTTATGNLKMGANRITGLADGIAATDAASITQVTSAVAITGGTINGTTIGATTPSTVKATSLAVTGSTSGTISVVATAVAGTNTITLPAATGTVITTADVATQANQEAATSTTTFVSPARQQFHPSAAKVWLKCDISGNIQSSYNTTSVTDAGTGLVNVTIDTDFSNADYAILGTTFYSPLARVRCATIIAQAVGTFNAACNDEVQSRADPEFYYFVCFGDQ
jgi:hypothetical protein